MDPIPILNKQVPPNKYQPAITKKDRNQKINNTGLNVCSWNIRRGLVKRESELKNIINTNYLSVIFLVETDTYAINQEEDYQISGFKTLVQKKKDTNSPTRIICLVDKKLASRTLIRHDLTSTDFPSIWLELEQTNQKNMLMGGFYREWSPGGEKSIEAQLKAMRVFTNQIEQAALENKNIVILGDANLCSIKWNSPNFLHKKISDELQDTLTNCGLSQIQMGITYTADRLSAGGSEITSALDHIYISTSIENKIRTRKLDTSATDHLPIVVNIEDHSPIKTKTAPDQPVLRRSMKNFNKTRWTDSLRNRDWSNMSALQDIDEKTTEFTNQITSALDECAPYKSVKTRHNFKPGITSKAKQMMLDRDRARKDLSNARKEDKPALKTKYKHLRNRVISQLRRDTLQQNGDRIERAGNEGETWRIINDIIKPRSSASLTVRTPEGEISDEEEIAEVFNQFFVNKINTLKANIDKSDQADPLEKIKNKVKDMNLKFSLKTVTVKAVRKIMKQMKKKKSKGNDGITQECLLLGEETLAGPLTEIINQSIETGTFPTQWREAVVVPILKKGDTKDPKNYRPVSCLAAASKVLEKVVCNQLTRYIEVHKLLPNNQHGFRRARSTMTALSSMQKQWIRNTEEGVMTGILVWDLSAAFDTLDIDLFLMKMELYGADRKTLDWFRSFLCGRTQRVKIGNSISPPLELTSGVPQGGILSPIVFTLYTADMELWLKTSGAFNFADDTTTDNRGKNKEEIKTRLEEDAKNVLKFMASNGLVANNSKTEFLLLNEKNKDVPLTEIKVGDSAIMRTKHTKLLGVKIEESQEWDEQLKTTITSLNHRLFIIRRIAQQIPQNKLMSVVHSLWISKLRYGLQLYSKVQLTNADKVPALMKALQITQNRLLRALNKTRTSDKVSIVTMLEKFRMLSVNQLAAEIKLIEVWKAANVEGCPTKLDPYVTEERKTNIELRPKTNRIFNDTARLKVSQSSFNIDAARIWNNAPEDVHNATTLSSAKRAIKTFCKSLPI